MARKASKSVYAGMKGWEIQYLKKAEAYGYLTPQGKGSKKQQHKFKGK